MTLRERVSDAVQVEFAASDDETHALAKAEFDRLLALPDESVEITFCRNCGREGGRCSRVTKMVPRRALTNGLGEEQRFVDKEHR